MRDKFFRLATLGIICGWAFASLVFASDQRHSSEMNEEREIRKLMSHWFEAYEKLDAKGIAGLESPDVEIVDRFGELHLPSGRRENEQLWTDTFEVVSRNTL